MDLDCNFFNPPWRTKPGNPRKGSDGDWGAKKAGTEGKAVPSVSSLLRRTVLPWRARAKGPEVPTARMHSRQCSGDPDLLEGRYKGDCRSRPTGETPASAEPAALKLKLSGPRQDHQDKTRRGHPRNLQSQDQDQASRGRPRNQGAETGVPFYCYHLRRYNGS